MISWIQTTFEKHTKVFLAFLLVAITIPFVFTIGATPGISGGDQRIKHREFFGYNLVSQADARRLQFDAQLSIMLRVGYMMPMNGGQLQEYSLQRAASLGLADSYRIPQPTATQRDKFITTLRIFQNEKGEFDSLQYSRVRDQWKTGADFSEADVARIINEEFRIQQLSELLAGPGYVAPIEVANQMALSTTDWSIDVASFDLGAYNPVIAPNDELLAQYYQNNAGRFEIDERASVDYVTFKAADFTSAAPLSDDDVVAYFEANKQRFAAPPAEGQAAVEPTLATVRPQVEAAMRTAQAGHAAASAASDFAYELFDLSNAQKINKSSPEIDAIIAKYKGRRATAPFFTRQAGPAGLNWSRQLTTAAFQLDDSRFYSDALPNGADQIVLLWRETLPKYQPELAEIRADVLAAYNESEKSSALHRNGLAWKAAIETKLATGADFTQAAASLSGAPQTTVKSYGPFSRRQPAEGVPGPVLGTLDRLAAGGVSDLLLDEKNAYFVHVAAKKLPTIDGNSPDYIQLGAALSANVANTTRSIALADLVQSELARSAPTTAEDE